MQLTDMPTKFRFPFAINAAAQNVTATLPDTTTVPGRASLQVGFPPETFQPVAAGGTPPFGQDMNKLFQQLSSWARWQAAGAPIVFDGTFGPLIGGYPKGACITKQDLSNYYWLNTVDNNTSNPETGGAGWLIVAKSCIEQGGGPSQTADKVNIGKDGVAGAALRYSIGANDMGLLADQNWVEQYSIERGGGPSQLFDPITIGKDGVAGAALRYSIDGADKGLLADQNWVEAWSFSKSKSILTFEEALTPSGYGAAYEAPCTDSISVFIQIGTVTSYCGTNNFAYSLPVPFPNVFAGIVINFQASVPPTMGAVGAQMRDLASFTVTNTAIASPTTPYNGCHFIAMGW